MWQTIVGTWPIDGHRLWGYLEKAVREAKLHTSWTEPDEAYEADLRAFVELVLEDDEVVSGVVEWTRETAPYARVGVLGQKLVQLTMPGVPDVYQGCELPNYSLVDPDNRRPVDYEAHARLLRSQEDGASPDDLAAEKLLITSRALRLRRDHPAWFGADGSYQPIETTTDHAFAFARGGEVITVVTRLAAGLERNDGFGAARAPRYPLATGPTCSPHVGSSEATATRSSSPTCSPRSRSHCWSGPRARAGLDAGALRLDVEVGHRPLQVHRVEVLDQQLSHRPVAVPLAVGRHDVPRRRRPCCNARAPPRTPPGTAATARARRHRRGCTSSAWSGRRAGPAAAPAAPVARCAA